MSRLKDVLPACCCDGADDSPWYTQLRPATNPEQLREPFEKRLGFGLILDFKLAKVYHLFFVLNCPKFIKHSLFSAGLEPDVTLT